MLTETGAIDHAASVKRIAEVALAYAKAGKLSLVRFRFVLKILLYITNLFSIT